MKTLTLIFLVYCLTMSWNVGAQYPQAGWTFSYPGDAFTSDVLQ